MSLIWNETAKAAILAKWNIAKPTRLDAAKGRMAHLVKNRARYEAVEKRTGVPWWFIMCLHEREGAGDMATYLGDGEKLTHVTHLVPKGRGPFDNFEDGAVDALVHEGFHKIVTWSIARILFCAEQYNGPGYHNKGLTSPYVWAGTDQYTRGKYDQDGHFVASLVDTQLGVATMIMALIDMKLVSVGAAVKPVAPANVAVSGARTAVNAIGGVGGAVAATLGAQQLGVDTTHTVVAIGGTGLAIAALWSHLYAMASSNAGLTSTLHELETRLQGTETVIRKAAEAKKVAKKVTALKATDPVVAAAHIDDDGDDDDSED